MSPLELRSFVPDYVKEGALAPCGNEDCNGSHVFVSKMGDPGIVRRCPVCHPNPSKLKAAPPEPEQERWWND